MNFDKELIRNIITIKASRIAYNVNKSGMNEDEVKEIKINDVGNKIKLKDDEKIIIKDSVVSKSYTNKKKLQ